MARHIEFCREKALTAATEVFLSKGYEAASLEELVTAMEIGRQSLYNTFGDKRGLFLQALHAQIDHYADKMRRHFNAEDNTPNVKERISDWLALLRHRDEKNKRLGCILINTSVELGGRDLEIADLMCRHQRNQEDIFYHALSAARARGEIQADLDCRVIARYLVGCIAGMIVLGKADPNSPTLDAMSTVALSVLDH